MLKKIWQSFVRWFRNLFGRGTSGSTLAQRGSTKDRIAARAELPPLDDTDREYLFMQLLEGVAHGWQQPRAIAFFNKIRQRVRKSEWLDWLERFGNNLLEAPVANYELAGRMVQLGQLDCGEIGDLAGEYGARLLDRQAEQYAGDLLPIMEFDELEFDRLDDQIPFALGDGSDSSQYRQFGDVPPELLIDNASIPSPPFVPQPEAAPTASETREITLEEFSAMLHQDPGLVAELAEQFGVETTDPQTIVNIVVAQMQQQVQQVSGDLSPISSGLTPPTVEPGVPTVPPAVPTPGAPPEIPAAPPAVPTPTTPPEVPTQPPAVPTPTTPPEIPATPPVVPTPTTPPEVPSVPAAPPEMPPASPEVPSIPSAPPEMPPATPEVPSIPSAPPEISPVAPTMPGISAKQHSAPPPPPPFPKLEYKPEDPWQNTTPGDREPTPSEAANTPDRRGV